MEKNLQKMAYDVVKQNVRTGYFGGPNKGCFLDKINQGVSMQSFVRTLGIDPQQYGDFLQSVANAENFEKYCNYFMKRGSSDSWIYEIIADKLSFDKSSLSPQLDRGESVSIDSVLDGGDSVHILPRERTLGRWKRQFLTAYDEKSDTLGLCIEPEYEGHECLYNRHFKGQQVIEGGFAELSPVAKVLKLYGKTTEYGQYPGQYSKNLLEKALPDWSIDIEPDY